MSEELQVCTSSLMLSIQSTPTNQCHLETILTVVSGGILYYRYYQPYNPTERTPHATLYLYRNRTAEIQ